MIGPGLRPAVGAKTVKRIAIVVGIVAVIALVAGYEIAVWRECMSDHPWWYCLRIIGAR